jgi:hypothetical protein
MKPFTEQQAAILGTIQRLQRTITELLIQQAERRCHASLAAVISLLEAKEILQPEEFVAAKARAEAGMAVDEALNPELQAAWEEFGRVFGELLEQGQDLHGRGPSKRSEGGVTMIAAIYAWLRRRLR